MSSVAFQQGETLSDLFLLLGPIAAIVLVVAVMLWFVAWLTRYFEYLKTLESRWIDRGTLDFVRRGLEAVWVSFLAIIVLAIASTQSEDVRGVFVALIVRVPALFFVIFVLFVAAFVVRLLHRFAAYLRGELGAKPRRAAPQHALAFTEIVLKYVLYVGALSIAVLGGIRVLPADDQTFIAANIGTLPSPDRGVALGILVAIAIVFVADRFVNSIFEDLRGRTRKFSGRVLEEFKSIARYAVWLVSAVVVLFVLLGSLLTPEQLVVFAVGFVAFLVLFAVLVFDPVRSALAGVALMRADPFDIGDRVRIGDDLVCDVVTVGLATTHVRTAEGDRVIIPNTRLLDVPVTNLTRSRPCAVVAHVSITFDVGHAKVSELLVGAATATEGLLREPPPRVLGDDADGDSIRYRVIAYTDDPAKTTELRSALLFHIQEALQTAGIIRAPPGPTPRQPPSGG